jgi:uncharacterized 2Fe-2S/4Fe-4S cluster protein (DUF4445 family)
MLSTYIVEVGQPLSTFTSVQLVLRRHGRLYTCSSATGGALSNQRITLLQGTAAPPHQLQ